MLDLDALTSELSFQVLQKTGELSHVDRIDIEKIAHKLGLKIENKIMAANGLLVKIENEYSIYVNTTLSNRRRRFTIAHEIGHVVFRTQVDDAHPLKQLGTKFEEKFCDRFAANLLMPDQLVDFPISWDEFTFSWLIERSIQLGVNSDALARKVVARLPFQGGILVFRFMGKPNDWADKKWRLHWGDFPNSGNLYIPMYTKVSKDLPIMKCLVYGSFEGYANLKFGSLKETRYVKAISNRKKDADAILTQVLPKELEPSEADLPLELP
jgi:Zn-dependent peptidase ImmA (M78 family)